MTFRNGMSLHKKINLNVPFTTCYGLVNVIKKNEKANLKRPIQNIKYDATVSTITISSIYSSLSKITANTKLLCHRFTENTIQKVYHMSFTVTNEVKIKMFQF